MSETAWWSAIVRSEPFMRCEQPDCRIVSDRYEPTMTAPGSDVGYKRVAGDAVVLAIGLSDLNPFQAQ